MEIKIALAGNPNSGKTTLFNALTGSNQFVGNWPGVTVEKKEGKLKQREDVTVVDLPGIYSLSPYTMEEVIARNYLIDERPDAILNIVDASNIERNLYLTTQLVELGIPVVVALNMMDVVRKNGDKINFELLSRQLGCKVVPMSALKSESIFDAAEAAIEAVNEGKTCLMHTFSGSLEHAIAHIEERCVHDFPEEQQRWYAIKLFERDKRVLERLSLSEEEIAHIEADIAAVERMFDDDAESIITNERYVYIAKVLKDCYKKHSAGKKTVSDKIDSIVTNRILALPIFAVIMFLVYFISVTTVGTWVTDWTNDGLFGDGFHLFGIGSKAYNELAEEYVPYAATVEAFEAAAEEKGLDAATATALTATAKIVDEETGEVTEEFTVTHADYLAALAVEEPDPAAHGVWVPGIPVLVENLLIKINCAPWLSSLLLDGIIGGVGAVLGFVPQMLVLFLFLAFLEACGYMSRIAFVLDRIFRKFGLSGKSFIPLLVGTGCGVPGIMASRTIENESDRRMTVITTTFIPCGAKLPVVGLIAGAMFGGAWWVAPSAYFVGIIAVVISGIMLKKTQPFSGEASPFVMELPAYHMPTFSNVMRSMWERGWSFIKKAGTVILLSAAVLWFLQTFGFENGAFCMVEDLNHSVLAYIGKGVSWMFAPLGWGNWQSAVATVTGLIAKENIVGTFGVLFSGYESTWAGMQATFSTASAYSFLVFNLLCAPCFAAMGAIKREMNNWKWTVFAIAYQCVFAYIIALIVYQLVSAFVGAVNVAGLIAAILLLLALVFMIVRPDKIIRARAKK
ncbi:MAG: ferrous iron transport protein B [Clostridia bacterium]|nr:ferrous iron transport protein B [Clostridia bacterium]